MKRGPATCVFPAVPIPRACAAVIIENPKRPNLRGQNDPG